MLTSDATSSNGVRKFPLGSVVGTQELQHGLRADDPCARPDAGIVRMTSTFGVQQRLAAMNEQWLELYEHAAAV
jgi:hypothetical protein